MHEAIAIITWLRATAEEFCSVATFSDMKQCRSDSCQSVCEANKEPHNCDARSTRRGTLHVQFTPLGNAAYLTAGWTVSCPL